MSDRGWTEKLIPKLYEDDLIIAVSKPAGIDASCVQPGRASGVAELVAQSQSRDRPLVVAKRLTRDESGVLLLCKTEAAARDLRAKLRSNNVTHEYVAAITGVMKQKRIVIDNTHGASRGKIPKKTTDRSARHPPPRRDTAKAAPAAGTVITLMEAGARRSVVRCRTTVATTHALRAQMRAVKLRIVGDCVNERTYAHRKPQPIQLHLASIAFTHPTSGRRLKIDANQPKMFDRTLHGKIEIDRPCVASAIRRLGVLEQRTTNAYRVLTGDSEGLFGINVERYGTILVVQVLDARKIDDETVLEVAKWYQRTLGISSVYVKSFVRDRVGVTTATERGLRDTTPLIGPAVEPEINVHEYGLLFAIRPYDGFSVGLFPDHRENRQRVRAQSQDKDVLNLFCYTGSFSVAAAAGGATSVTSVDIAKKNLEWSRRNFALNGQDAASQSFICEDARAYLARAKRRGTAFDMIILDPPTFAHGKGKRGSFSVVDNLSEITAAAIEILRPDGVLMISSNYRKLSLKDLRATVRQAAGSRKISVTDSPPLPADYAVDSNHAKTMFVRVR